MPVTGNAVASPRCPKSVNVSDFVTEGCERRSRLAALRDHVEAAPVRLYSAVPALPDGAREVQRHGSYPDSIDATMRLINSLRPENSTRTLTADDVYTHWMEAANTNFIDDRWMFLGKKTLKNTAAAANRGFAFMNSHRTGGLSSPSELPFGRTFAGVYEHYKLPGPDGNDTDFRRSVIGAYMLKGEHPNGINGPSTDAIHNGIDAGTIFDVSLGYSADAYHQYLCDVCGMDMDEYSYDENGDAVYCRHIPGTHYKMTAAEIESQAARGVPNGYATYTLENATPGEVSAVYNGAVPGAGFRKALAFARSGNLSSDDLKEVVHAYRRLGNPAAFRRFSRMSPNHPSGGDELADLAKAVVDSGIIPGLTFQSPESEVPDQDRDPDPQQKGGPVATENKEKTDKTPDPEVVALKQQIEKLEKENADRDERERKQREEDKRLETQRVLKFARKAAHDFAVSVCGGDPKKDAKLSTEKFDRVNRLRFAIGCIDSLSPVTQTDAEGNEVEYEMVPDFEAIVKESTGSSMFRERIVTTNKNGGLNIPAGMSALNNHEGSGLESVEKAREEGHAKGLALAARINKQGTMRD